MQNLTTPWREGYVDGERCRNVDTCNPYDNTCPCRTCACVRWAQERVKQEIAAERTILGIEEWYVAERMPS